jgi:hypothetical protein
VHVRAGSSGICTGEVADAGNSASDTNRVVSAETECDCEDEDMDVFIDEGCAAQGAGNVLWRLPLDGAGEQRLRGGAVGGDGRLYVNGYLAAEPIDAGVPFDAPPSLLCNGTHQGSEGFLIGVGSLGGPPTCETVFEGTASFAAPAPGRRGAWSTTTTGISEVQGATSIDTVTSSEVLFGVSDVQLRPGPSNGRLVRFWSNTMSSTLGGVSILNEFRDVVGYTEEGMMSPLWTTTAASPSAIGWVDADHFYIVTPSDMFAGSCMQTSSRWRIEEHSFSAPDACDRVLDLDLPTPALRFADPPAAGSLSEITAAYSDGRYWVLARDTRAYHLRVVQRGESTVSGDSIFASSAGFEPSAHLRAADDGTVFVATTEVLEGRSRGLIRHVRLSAGAIEVLGIRRVDGFIGGMAIGPDRTVYITTSTDGSVSLCNGTRYTADRQTTMITAIRF